MLAEKITLTEEMRDKLIDHANKVIGEHIFTDALDILQEEDRYYNWYYGYSMIRRTFTNDDGLNYIIKTSAISGVVTSQYFGEQYQPNLVTRNTLFNIHVYPPESVRNNTNVTLHFDLERVSMNEYLSEGWDDMWVDGIFLRGGLTSFSFNYTPPSSDDDNILVLLERTINEENLKNIEMKLMPGTKIRWYYTGIGGTLTPDHYFSEFEENQLYIW